MDGDQPYCYRCRQTYGCICVGEQFTSADTIIKELQNKVDGCLAAIMELDIALQLGDLLRARAAADAMAGALRDE